MADELKSVLAKVLASGGEKKFFFAYGMGRRKDGKGDGALAVRGKKFKKDEVEGELVDCKEVFEGVCWAGKGPNDAETVYFQGRGKKLSPMLVAKMALAARYATGKQYDFQLPSPEEEARAEKFSEGEVDAAPAANTPQTPPPPPPPPAKTPDLQARLKSLLLRVKSLNATAPALKGKLDPLLQAAAGLVQQGSADALAALGRLEAALDAVRPDSTNVAAPTGMAEFNTRAKVVKAAIDQLKTADPARAADLARRLGQATASAMAKDFAAALAALDAIEAEAHAPAASPADRWNAERSAVVAQLEEEIRVVVATKDPDAGAAELELRAVVKQLSGQVATRQQAAEMERYLRQDDVVADVCELAFDLKTPLLDVLDEIKPQLAA